MFVVCVAKGSGIFTGWLASMLHEALHVICWGLLSNVVRQNWCCKPCMMTVLSTSKAV
jgi:hypothetical protein